MEFIIISLPFYQTSGRLISLVSYIALGNSSFVVGGVSFEDLADNIHFLILKKRNKAEIISEIFHNYEIVREFQQDIDEFKSNILKKCKNLSAERIKKKYEYLSFQYEEFKAESIDDAKNYFELKALLTNN